MMPMISGLWRLKHSGKAKVACSSDVQNTIKLNFRCAGLVYSWGCALKIQVAQDWLMRFLEENFGLQQFVVAVVIPQAQ